MKQSWAVIFDMDGTLLDNNPYHLKSWQEMCRRYGRELSEQEYKESLSGKSSADTIRYLFGDRFSAEETRLFRKQKEAVYRTLIEPFIAPLPGLPELLHALHIHQVPMAIATSASPDNIDFALDKLYIRHYFKAVVDSSMVTEGKPAPDIYLEAASRLHMQPERCLAFEDSLSGIRSAQAAGMQVIALTTAHGAAELSHADKVIGDYRELSYDALQEMIS